VSGQVRALASLRWQMVRSGPKRAALFLLAALGPALALGVAIGARLIPPDRRIDAELLAPTAYLAFLLLTLLAPLAAGGGYEMYPADQLVPYPVTARTHYRVSLLLAPLNIAWSVQVLGVLGLSSYFMTVDAGAPLGILTIVVFVAASTAIGQTLAWTILGMWRSNIGRAVVLGAITALVSVTAVLLLRHQVTNALDRSPTTAVAIVALNGDVGQYTQWFEGTSLFALIGVIGFLAGPSACAWYLRLQAGRTGQGESQPVRRRNDPATSLAALRAVDRASVWRSTSLRRGIVVLTITPAAIAVLARVDWAALVFVPGLVAAGAGLLFGVNVFCLDSTGAQWLSSLPHDPDLVFRAKTWVLTEVCLGAVLVATLAAMLRTTRAPTVNDLAAVLAVVLGATATVVAACMRLSVAQPHRADLRGARDTPAPPAAMTAYSLRLAWATTVVAFLLDFSLLAGSWWTPLLAGFAVLLLAGRSLAKTRRAWADPAVRSRVVMTVASG